MKAAEGAAQSIPRSAESPPDAQISDPSESAPSKPSPASPLASSLSPDWSDCQQCLEGRQDACASLFKRYERIISRQMWRFTRDAGACEELVQEVFVQAYLSLRRYRPGQAPFEHWLRRIATRVGYRFWKQQARQRKHAPISLQDFDQPSDQIAGEIADAARRHPSDRKFERQPTEKTARGAMRDRTHRPMSEPAARGNDKIGVEEQEAAAAAALLHQLLGRLSPPDRVVLTLMYFEACGTQEIADRTGWNRAMVKMRAMRARRRLKKIIEDEGLLDRLESLSGE